MCSEKFISTIVQLEAERQAHAEARRIIAGLVERIPAIEPPPDTSGSPQTARDDQDRVTQPRPDDPGPHEGLQRERSWWRRWFGG